jgi:hypothetical protein
MPEVDITMRLPITDQDAFMNELAGLSDEELRLKAVAMFVLRNPKLGLVGLEAAQRGNANLVKHVADLNGRIYDGRSKAS